MRILFIAHRAPFPPDKGERIRAFHILRHLANRHEVHLAAHADPADLAATERALADPCPGLCLRPLGGPTRLRRFADAFVRGRAPSLHAFRDRRLRRWVRERLAGGVDLVFLYSGAAAEALPGELPVPLVADLVDCDSAKWRDLAARARDPLHRAVFAREARLVARAERRILERAALGLVAAKRERDELLAVAPDVAGLVEVVENGVDRAFFDPDAAYPDPYPPDGCPTLVFTGAMDYPPNVEAALGFASEVLPRLEAAGRKVRFAVVGRDPVRALARLHDGRRVLVTGLVPDIRPFLAHAAVAVVPLAVARGVQNKLLEAMAMARPVVASPEAAAGIRARPGEHLLLASEPAETAAAVLRLLDAPDAARELGRRARRLVLEHYRWEDRLAALDALLEGVTAAAATPRSRASSSTTAALASQVRPSR